MPTYTRMPRTHTCAWRLRLAFENLTCRIGDDVRVRPSKSAGGFQFDTHDCTPCAPAIALVHLRHAAFSPGELAARKREAAAARIAAIARGKAARNRRRRETAERRQKERAAAEEAKRAMAEQFAADMARATEAAAQAAQATAPPLVPAPVLSAAPLSNSYT